MQVRLILTWYLKLKIIHQNLVNKLQKWAIRTISNRHTEATQGHYCLSIVFLTFMILINSTLVYLCINNIQISYQVITPLIFTQTHNYSTRNAQDYTINKTKKAFSYRAIRNCGP